MTLFQQMILSIVIASSMAILGCSKADSTTANANNPVPTIDLNQCGGQPCIK